jgi:hypothetical protein
VLPALPHFRVCMRAFTHNENGGKIENLVNIASLVMLLLLLQRIMNEALTPSATGRHLPRSNVASVCCLQGRRFEHDMYYFVGCCCPTACHFFSCLTCDPSQLNCASAALREERFSCFWHQGHHCVSRVCRSDAGSSGVTIAQKSSSPSPPQSSSPS